MGVDGVAEPDQLGQVAVDGWRAASFSSSGPDDSDHDVDDPDPDPDEPDTGDPDPDEPDTGDPDPDPGPADRSEVDGTGPGPATR